MVCCGTNTNPLPLDLNLICYKSPLENEEKVRISETK